MTIEIKHTCTRCRRVTSQDATFDEAKEDDVLASAKATTLKKLLDFVETLDKSLLPDLLVLRPDAEPLVQTHLCDDEDAKRSCAKRCAALVSELEPLEERKPRTKKAAAPPSA